MKKMFYVLIISLAFFTVPVNAEDTSHEEYVVKKGDTLWDISNSKLQDSFLWPKLWKENSQIKNPDRIYPGDKIRIPLKETLAPKVEAAVEEMPVMTKQKKVPAKEEKLVAAEILKETPKKFIVDKDSYIESGWICDKKFPGIGKITSAPESRSIAGKNELVYIKTDNSTKNGEKFFVIRTVKKVKHPKTRDFLGYLIKIHGVVEVVGMDNGTPKARVITSFEELQVGDGLLPYTEMEPPVIPDIVKTPDIHGHIVASNRNTILANAGDIVYLDKGKNNGLEIGSAFSLFSEIPVKRTIGTLQIIALQPTTSKAVILNIVQEATVGDMWGKE